MKVKIYKRKTDHPADELLGGISKTTTLVRLNPDDYEEPRSYDVDFEDRIICGAEDILSNPNKVLGIIDMELFWKSGCYLPIFENADLVEIDAGLFIKYPDGYAPAEIK